MFQGFKIGETEHQSRGNERGNHRNSDGERKIALPKEIKLPRWRQSPDWQDGRVSGYSGSSTILERSRADGQRLDLRPALCHELRSRVVDAGVIWTYQLLG